MKESFPLAREVEKPRVVSVQAWDAQRSCVIPPCYTFWGHRVQEWKSWCAKLVQRDLGQISVL